jgi:hypothetical protein
MKWLLLSAILFYPFELLATPPYFTEGEIRHQRLQKGEGLSSEEMFEEALSYRLRFPALLKSARGLVEDEMTAIMCAYLPYRGLRKEIENATQKYRLLLSSLILEDKDKVLYLYADFFVSLKRIYDLFDVIYECVPCEGGGCLYQYSSYGL